VKSGTFGIVYKVLDKKNHDEEIALKCIRLQPRSAPSPWESTSSEEYDILKFFSRLKSDREPLTKWLLEPRGELMYDATEHTLGIPMKFIPHVPFSVLKMSARTCATCTEGHVIFFCFCRCLTMYMCVYSYPGLLQRYGLF